MNKFRLYCTLAVVLSIYFLSPVFVGGLTVVHAAVVINEIFPKTEDVTLEWIELYNTGDTSVSLNQWKLSHSAGDAKSFIFNARVIDPHGFMLFSQPDTGISLDKSGDTVRLMDDRGTTIDSQSYLGTLGYNTSMGRSPDGGISWTACTVATANKPNDCPQATPTQTPTPTPIPTNTPIPTATGIPVPTENQLQGALTYQPADTNSVLGSTTAPSPSPTPMDNLFTIRVPNMIAISRPLAIQILVVLGAWIMLVFIALARRKRKPRR
jgi:hypothetical protein